MQSRGRVAWYLHQTWAPLLMEVSHQDCEGADFKVSSGVTDWRSWKWFPASVLQLTAFQEGRVALQGTVPCQMWEFFWGAMLRGIARDGEGKRE